MHRLVITAKLAPGTTHQQIARFISQNRPAMQKGGATGMMIRCGGTLQIILEGPEAVTQATASAARSSGLFTAAKAAGAVPIRFRAFDKICLAYAKPEHLGGSLRREIGLLTGLELPQQPLAA
ncbi:MULTISPECIES: hypothetical protein [Leisingera]|jgi:hypothetical protein|uniref:hypothetical protein n=1 Tax=Leisingera TaxID=191028 RepID=UPI001154A219|nr:MULTISPECIES: hypothetical protein [Leisingera]QDI75314.1 hypothetical protein R2C4_05935 [Leisingera aquaemixtae]UWQ23587.1 hypothetical protein K3553_11380 [Leisingera aquaemixtae]UWQ44478.1 hypothetical protein K3719_11775 [Leisingera aquaemixtae]